MLHRSTISWKRKAKIKILFEADLYIFNELTLQKKTSKKMLIDLTLLQFLEELKSNNNRDWFNINKERYQIHLESMKKFVAVLQTEMEKHDFIEKAKLYRIYKDVRFSKDKLPYKNHFAGWLKRATNQRRGGYYFHIEPSNTIIAGGFWRPSPNDLKRIREEIAANDAELRTIIADTAFRNTFGTLDGEMVKTAPRGFSKTHSAIDLIRKKQFVVSRHFSDTEVLQENFLEEVVQTFLCMRPFFDYMSVVLTTDANGLPVKETD